MNTYCVVRSSRPAELFSFGLLDGLQVRLCRPYLREAPADFSFGCLTTTFMNSPGRQDGQNSRQHRSRIAEHLNASDLCSLRPRWRAVLTIRRAHEELLRSAGQTR